MVTVPVPTSTAVVVPPAHADAAVAALEGAVTTASVAAARAEILVGHRHEEGVDVADIVGVANHVVGNLVDDHERLGGGQGSKRLPGAVIQQAYQSAALVPQLLELQRRGSVHHGGVHAQVVELIHAHPEGHLCHGVAATTAAAPRWPHHPHRPHSAGRPKARHPRHASVKAWTHHAAPHHTVRAHVKLAAVRHAAAEGAKVTPSAARGIPGRGRPWGAHKAVRPWPSHAKGGPGAHVWWASHARRPAAPVLEVARSASTALVSSPVAHPLDDRHEPGGDGADLREVLRLQLVQGRVHRTHRQ
mmetsp:Transcript_18365/g.51472  ORF Transcript_18365/g.51472 Transcript_18365/m.51472 type:complete len:303 (+) Transcript_18365:562-1470(+)